MSSHGRPAKKEYRTYTVKGDAMDDLRMMREVVERWIKRVEDWPDLLLIDGGETHLSIIAKLLEKHGGIHGEVNSGIAIKSMAGIIDLSIGIDGKIPLDLGLEGLIDLKKGCYPGQEIHARMESREAINKTASSFSSIVQLPLGKVKTTENHRMEVISSEQLGEEWISILIHRKDLDIYSEIQLKTADDEIIIKNV